MSHGGRGFEALEKIFGYGGHSFRGGIAEDWFSWFYKGVSQAGRRPVIDRQTFTHILAFAHNLHAHLHTTQ